MLAWTEMLLRQSADEYVALKWTVGRNEYTENYLVNKYSIRSEHVLNLSIQFCFSLKPSSNPKPISTWGEWGKEVVLLRFCFLILEIFVAACIFNIEWIEES